MDVFQADIAGQTIRYKFIYPLTRLFFWGRLEPSDENGPLVSVSESDIERCRGKFPEGALDGQIEFKALISRTSAALLSDGPACIFHSAAVNSEGKAWLFTAPSGTGKSTQVMNWLKIGDRDPGVICGDMPALRLEDDGTVTVYPSPWNGKENLRGAPAAPLGGIICLEKADENTVRLLAPAERIGRCMTQFVCSPEDGAQADNLALLADSMLSNYPVWLMKNRGDMASTELMLDVLFGNSIFADEDDAAPGTDKPDLSSAPDIPDGLYFIRKPGVYLEKICGCDVLVASKEVRGQCPYVSVINGTSAILWDYLSEERNVTVCVMRLVCEYPFTDPKEIDASVRRFIGMMEKAGYLISYNRGAYDE